MGDLLIRLPQATPGTYKVAADIAIKMRTGTSRPDNAAVRQPVGDTGPSGQVRQRRRSSAQRSPYTVAAEAAASNYDRARHLPPLLALWPQELADFGRTGCEAIVARLEKALRQERRRREQSHWCYDINRHAALVSALKAERLHLQGLV